MGTVFEPTSRMRLANGLQVLSRRLSHAPVVCSMVWYGVGSRNEDPGQTGVSHFLEHMMFKGTPKFPYGVLEEGVKARGGMWNAFTSYDYTAYYEVLPARHLEHGLEVEADRMVNMTFDPDLTVRERGIILSEREGRENSPYFWLFDAFMHEAYRRFPYRHAILGYREDIRSMTAEGLTAHYRRYYRPNNATLVVAGDVDPDRLLELAEKHFGSIPPGPPVEPVAVEEPEQNSERRVTVRRPGPNPYLIMGYKIPGAGHPDQPALTILSGVLSGGPSFGSSSASAGMGRSTRLYQGLVATGLAISAGAYSLNLQYPGLYMFSAVPAPGVELERVEAAITAEIARLQSEPVPEAELNRAKKQVRTQFLYGMEGVMSQATLLGSTAVTRGVEQFDGALAAFEAVTAEDLLRVARTYLRPERRTVGWFLPQDAAPSVPAAGGDEQRGDAQGVSETTPSTFGATPPHQIHGQVPVILPASQGTPARIIQPERVMRAPLPGGAALLVYPLASLPSVFVRVQLEAGAVFDPHGQEGLAQLTAQVAARATRSLSPQELALRTDELGLSLRVDITRETAVGTLKCLPEDLETGLGYLMDLLVDPALPEDEFQRLRDKALVTVRQAENDTRTIATLRLREMLYPPGHPYGRRGCGTEASLANITREDLVAFHQRCYRPAGAVVTVVGSVDPDRVCRALQSLWAGWTGGPGRYPIPDVTAPQGGHQHYTVEGKSLTDVAMGWPLVSRHHPDYLALSFLATLLGGNGTPATSRLFRNVRERYGVSYYQFAAFGAALGPSPWTVHIGVNPSRLAFALDRVRDELRRLRDEPVSAQELNTLKAFLADYPAVQHESPERLAARLAEIERNGLGLDFLERQEAAIQELTPQQLQAAAQRHFDLDRLCIATAGPEPL